MNQDILISFIIPVHNAEKTVERTVRSILDNQNLENIEIILIENASEDMSLQVCEQLSKTIKQVRVFTSQPGVSNGRNLGLQRALGKWIAFADADDVYLSGVVDVMLEDAKDDELDLVLYGHMNGSREVPIAKKTSVLRDNDVNIARLEMLKNPTRYMTVWGKLFKRSFIVNYNLKFNASLNLAEDSDFFIEYLLQSRVVKKSREIVYNYLPNNSSTVRAYNGIKLKGYVKSLEVTGLRLKNSNQDIKEAYAWYVMMHFNIIMVRENFALENQDTWRQKQKVLHEVLKMSIFDTAIRKIKLSDCLGLRMIPVLLMKLKCYNLAGIVYTLRVLQNKKNEQG